MTILSPKRNFKKDLEKVKTLTAKIEKKLSESTEPKIDNLTNEQLQDLNTILHLSDYLLCKYEDKKDFHVLLKEFVDMIQGSVGSIEEIDGEIEELVLSAEDSILRIKDAQTKVAEKVDFDKPVPESNLKQV